MQVVRDGAIDALHAGHVVVVDRSGRVLAAHGDPTVEIYPRSAVKPFQAAAALRMARTRPPDDEVAIMTASHTGTRAHQATVQRVLDRAGVTTMALQCPEALPTDRTMLRQNPGPTRLAHNCSGKHAGFLLAVTAVGQEPAEYLSVESELQRRVVRELATACATNPAGPGVDGCGAPAWRMPLRAMAQGFVTLAQADAQSPLGAVAAAMRTHPLLVAGHGMIESELMRADDRVLAKRGAEGCVGIAAVTSRGPVGIAVKVADGAIRALGPAAVAVLDGLGLSGAASLRSPPVLGGGVPHGAIAPAPELVDSLGSLG